MAERTYIVPVAPLRVARRVLEAAIDDVREKLRSQRMIGSLEHPADGRLRLTDASHIVHDLRMEDGRLVVELEFVDNEQGHLAENFLSIGHTYPVHAALRAQGTRDKVGLIQDMKIVGVDLCTGPLPDEPAAVDRLGDLVR